MKKTITINLGGTVFNIDEDAYQLLRNYLKKIESHFSDTEERQEIINDIEARIAEILNSEGDKGSRPVTLLDIEEIIRVMGEPEDIADSANEESGNHYEKRSRHRRVYRDVDSRVLGGVCSGLAKYWSVDVVWIRIIFILLFLLFLSGPLIYLLLWIIIPPAVTTAQKLEMRGEPVNISNIGNFVKDEFNNVRRNLNI